MILYFAGGENHNLSVIPDTSILISYHGIKGEKKAKSVAKWYRNHRVVIDSGAATFQKGISPTALSNFFVKYLIFVNDNYFRNVDWFAEMDVDNMVGLPQVDRYYERLLNVSEKVMRVWHITRGIERWKEYCKRSEFVGIGGIRTGLMGSLKIEAGREMVLHAYKQGVKVHGFGITKPEILDQVPFYSVDSTTWLDALKFGAVMYFTDAGELKNLPSKRGINSIDPKYWLHTTRINDYRENLRKTMHKSVMCSVVKEFLKMQDYYTKLWKRRGVDWERRMV